MPSPFPFEGAAAYEPGWPVALEAEDLADALRSAMREEYAGASNEAMADALEAVLGSMSPAEAFNFSQALDRIGKGASQLAKDPTFRQVVSTAAPILLQAAGTAVGGPAAGAIASQLGTVGINALLGGGAQPPAPPPGPAPSPPPAPPSPPAAPPAGPAPSPPAAPPSPPPAPPSPPQATPAGPMPSAVPAPPVSIPAQPAAPVAGAPTAPVSELPPPTPGPGPSVVGGSAAAAQALVLTQQPDVLRSLLATALGRHGRQQTSSIPVAQVLALISQILGQAAADADELMYAEPQADSSESVLDDGSDGSAWSLYADLISADNRELAEAVRSQDRREFYLRSQELAESAADWEDIEL